jgi:hypothetical protein
MQEFEQVFAARRPEARGQVRDWALGQIAGGRVQNGVADASSAAGLGRTRSSADDEIVLAEPGHQSHRIRGMVLAVGVED